MTLPKSPKQKIKDEIKRLEGLADTPENRRKIDNFKKILKTRFK